MDMQLDLDRITRIGQGLIDLRQRGIIFGVWCDNYIFRIKPYMWSEIESLRYEEAEEMIALHLRKPPQSVKITDEKEKLA